MTTAVKERPILFSPPMVRAILDGRKTQTRRMVKPQPTHRLIEGLGHVTVGMDPALDGMVWYDGDCIGPGREVRCPYGRVGDRLWVRETWANGSGPDGDGIRYRADADHWPGRPSIGPDWRSPIHMPRWASRITLEITGVRVERLQDITWDDCWAEGVLEMDGAFTRDEMIDWAIKLDEPIDSPRPLFACLWDSINGKAHPWASDPWVWAITFTRI